MKQYRYEKQNLYEDIEKAYKPVIDVQREVRDTIDKKKQVKVIEKLQDHQNKTVKGKEFDSGTETGQKLPS